MLDTQGNELPQLAALRRRRQLVPNSAIEALKRTRQLRLDSETLAVERMVRFNGGDKEEDSGRSISF